MWLESSHNMKLICNRWPCVCYDLSWGSSCTLFCIWNDFHKRFCDSFFYEPFVAIFAQINTNFWKCNFMNAESIHIYNAILLNVTFIEILFARKHNFEFNNEKKEETLRIFFFVVAWHFHYLSFLYHKSPFAYFAYL